MANQKAIDLLHICPLEKSFQQEIASNAITCFIDVSSACLNSSTIGWTLVAFIGCQGLRNMPCCHLAKILCRLESESKSHLPNGYEKSRDPCRDLVMKFHYLCETTPFTKLRGCRIFVATKILKEYRTKFKF